MQEIPNKNGKDYSNLFLGIVLIGLVMMVVGLIMANAHRQSVGGDRQTPVVFERGVHPKSISPYRS